MPNNQAVSDAKALADKIFSNTGVERDVTKEDLQEVRDYIEELLDTLD